MAVEARHQNLFTPQLLSNRQMMNPIEANAANHYATQMGYGMPLTGTETLAPMYGSYFIQDSIPQKPLSINQSEDNSSLTYNNISQIPPSSRKRPRSDPISFLGHDISLHVQQQQLDIDRLISHHMEKVRMEIEERRKKQARKIMEAIEESVMNKLRSKDEEIEKIGKLNWALGERVKSLCIENQIWRDMAQTNEATANTLRTNLEQVLAAQANINNNEDQNGAGLDNNQTANVLMDDAQSCCGSSYEVEEEDHHRNGGGETGARLNQGTNRLCRICRKEESCVLILPCRHLCLCAGCGSSLHTCPICKSSKDASVHVNISS
ncbi:probable BOI-related E3 ubiquitin-protein ligase 3 [Rutidosis leptorrhynchoides]|uniref:probable BOI-related E3 ubiquitin-protein ligase 3 n=1 Tax=Rutidosis leptorrhynchoides TaxID=125765 RepID=UPI003A9A20B7